MRRVNWTVKAVTMSLVSLVSVSGCRSSAPVVQAPTSDIPKIEFEKYTLANGLEVILSEDHRLPLVAVDVWYHVGPANEAAGRTGFAHLFEHMMFQGSKHVPGDSHFRLLEAAGGTGLNGTTNFDRTNYFETLPANQLELGLWLESDRMGFLLDTVDAAKLANQQDVVRNERRQNTENVPYGIVNEAVFQTIFPKNHPYYGNVIGSHADIQAAKLEDVKGFFKQYYAPNNASLAIVGDFDKAATKALVEKYFGPLKRGPDVPKVDVKTPPISAERRVVVNDRVELPRVYMAWITPAFFAPGDADADVAASVLGGGNSSRLYKKLVYERQIAQDVSAFQYSLALGSTFQIVATVRPGHTAQEVEKAIDEELTLIRQSGPNEPEVARARNTFETGMLTGLEVFGGFGGVADTLSMFNHYTGDPGYLPKYLEEHRKVTPASVKGFTEKYLQPQARVVVHAMPGQQKLAANVATPPAAKTAPGTGAEAMNTAEPWRATQPKPAADRAINLPTPRSFKLANGLTVMYHERPGMPVVAADLVIKTGGDANPSNRPGLANYTAAMLDQGTQSRNALQLADDIAQLGASIGATSSKDAMIVSVGSLRKNFPAALDLLADVSMRPSFPPEEVERQRKSRLARIMASRRDPNTVATIATVAALYGNEHPYGFIELGSEAGVTATTPQDLQGFWKKNFVPGNAALVVAGAIGEAELKSLLDKTFGAWPAGTATPPSLNKPLTTTNRVVLVDQPGAPQTGLYVALIGPPRSTPDFADVSVMNAVLGGLFSSRVNLNLREKHGYTYGAFSQFVFRKGNGPFWISAPVRTDATAAAVNEIFNEVKRMTASPMTAEELAMAKDSIVRALPSDFETSAGTAGSLANLYIYDLGLDYYTKLPAQVNAVTVDTALAAAKKHLVPDKMIVVAVGDRAKIEPGLKKLSLGGLETRRVDGSVAGTGK